MIPHLHPHAGDCEHACCLKIEHLSVHIGGETILDNIDLHMHCGQMVALIGPNGAGKSTLIRAILGQREYEGKITFHEASGKEAKLRIGYVPQSPAFDRGDPVSVMDLFTCCIFKRPAFLRPTKAMREKVLACLANVHGEALIDKRIGTLSGGAPLSRVASSVRETLDQTPTPANAASQQMYIWKDASGVTHISETPPPKPPAGKVEEYQFSPQPPAAQPEPVAPLDIPSPEHQPSAAELEKAAAEARKRLQQQVEQLQKERGQLEKQLYRARATGDGYAQIRFRTLLEQNREALEKLIPKQ